MDMLDYGDEEEEEVDAEDFSSDEDIDHENYKGIYAE
jgi:hypothetical protein